MLDLVGGNALARSAGLMRDGGVLVSVPGPADPSLAVRSVNVLVEPDGAALAAIAALIDAGTVQVEVAEVFALADAARAHAVGRAGRTRGKLVLRAA